MVLKMKHFGTNGTISFVVRKAMLFRTPKIIGGDF